MAGVVEQFCIFVVFAWMYTFFKVYQTVCPKMYNFVTCELCLSRLDGREYG